MSSYTQLMRLSHKQTRAADAVAATAAAQLQRKLDEQRKARAVREAKEKEFELRLRKQRLEESAKEEERQARKELERQQKLKVIAAREAAQRDALLYGPKKAKAEQARQRDPARGNNKPSRSTRSSESPEPSTGPVLTREELREQKRLAEMRRTYSEASSSTKRSSASSSTKRRNGKDHMPGGAVPIVTTTVGLPANLENVPGKSTKDKIAAVPLTLTKLNINKRDVRTIDEILRDRERERQANRVIQGAEAKEFSDWFSKGKKKEVSPRKEASPATSSVPDSSQKSASSSRSGSVPVHSGSSATSVSVAIKPQPAKISVAIAPSSQSTVSRPAISQTATAKPNISATVKVVPTKPVARSPAPAPVTKKRPRSPSFSPEPAAKKRAVGSDSTPRSFLPDDVFSLITGGRSRNSYHIEDDASDLSDMEADAAFQEREERISALAAKKEDELALQELKRHEEEKRRKRLQKERDLAFRKKY